MKGTISGYYNTNDEIKFDKYKKKGAGYHWDQIGKTITKRNIFVVARYNIVLNQISDSKGKRILDVGCGDGVLSYLLSQKGAFVIGVDSSDKAIKFAKKKTRNIRNIEFIKASAYYLPFKRDSFDYVVSSDVIEHLQEPQKMLAEIKRVYNRKGKVIITTPLRFTDEPLDKMHVQEFFESEFRRLLSDYFTEIEIIKSHPLVFMELQNRHFLVKYLFNLLNLLFRFNPFEKTNGWRYYAIQTAVIEGAFQEERMNL
jgi:ubiquinone/menaquinone biosynthesis C-methylase UbiE